MDAAEARELAFLHLLEVAPSDDLLLGAEVGNASGHREYLSLGGLLVFVRTDGRVSSRKAGFFERRYMRSAARRRG